MENPALSLDPISSSHHLKWSKKDDKLNEYTILILSLAISPIYILSEREWMLYYEKSHESDTINYRIQ